MAQFVEVMEQARRICLEHPGDCDGCPLHDDDGLVCRFDLGEKYLYYDIAERIVLKWAEEHPEQVYPNWKEAWKKLFPNAREVPCPRKYFDEGCFPIFICAKHDCDRCKALQMDPEIAEKLGIRPIEIKKPASCGTCKYSDKSVWEAPCGTCKRAHGDCYPDQREEENDAAEKRGEAGD